MHKKWVQGLEISWEMRWDAYWNIYNEMRSHPEKTLYKIEFFKSPESNIYQFRNILFEKLCKLLGYNIFFRLFLFLFDFISFYTFKQAILCAIFNC